MKTFRLIPKTWFSAEPFELKKLFFLSPFWVQPPAVPKNGLKKNNLVNKVGGLNIINQYNVLK